MTEDQVRRFFLPFHYAMATANFVAVIQLISAPQFQLDWDTSPSSYLGLTGMTLMIASIPVSIAFAIYSEFCIAGKVPVYKHNSFISGAVSGLSVTALGITLASFKLIFGIVFGVVAIVAALIVVLLKTEKEQKG
jgi:hypothetical protein